MPSGRGGWMNLRFARVPSAILAGASLVLTGSAIAQPTVSESFPEISFSDMPGEPGEAARNAERAVDRALVVEAMRQLDLAEGQPVSRFFPLPSSVDTEIIAIALRSARGWRNPTRGYLNLGLEDEFLVWTMQAGHLAYYEWACRTGRDSAIIAEEMSQLQRLFTDYPQRLLLQDFDRNRRAMGYGLPTARNCLLSDLERGRRSYRESTEFLASL
jgi:hypothetical protein